MTFVNLPFFGMAKYCNGSIREIKNYDTVVSIYLSILQHPHYEYYVQLRCQCKS